MMIKLLSGILILITVFFSVKHGWGILTIKPGEPNMLNDLHFSQPVQIALALLTLAGGVLILFPPTFFSGNLINALIILVILAFQIKVDNIKAALIEIPFLLLPLLMIYLGHPFKK